MGRLEGKVALVAGGTGGVGEGIVRAMLDDGATVAVPSRSAQKLDALKDRLGKTAERLVAVVGELGDFAAAEKLRDDVLGQVGRLDAVVASINGRGETDRALAELSLDEWRGWLDANLTAHFITARTFLPVMAHSGSYTFIGGGAAHKPIPRYGVVCIPAAAQLMLVRVTCRGEPWQWGKHQRGSPQQPDCHARKTGG